MEDLPLGRIAVLVPEFAVKDLPLGRTLMMVMIASSIMRTNVFNMFTPFFMKNCHKVESYTVQFYIVYIELSKN